jgi:hypothetical protein
MHLIKEAEWLGNHHSPYPGSAGPPGDICNGASWGIFRKKGPCPSGWFQFGHLRFLTGLVVSIQYAVAGIP